MPILPLDSSLTPLIFVHSIINHVKWLIVFTKLCLSANLVYNPSLFKNDKLRMQAFKKKDPYIKSSRFEIIKPTFNGLFFNLNFV